MFKDKKFAKITAIAVAGIFLLGVFGLAISQSSIGHAANAGASSNIGKVNRELLIQQHPDLAKAEETMKAEVSQAKADFDSKSANMADKEKQDYYQQTMQRLELKRQELFAPIQDKVDAAIKSVADAKGISVVFDTSNVVYGGQDLTDEVLKKLTGK
ncbi:OmpH family outer membrane protein [Sporomusa acidovorans]|uniref:Outer membrane protein (OmpH-like) n=1 Tax=Sporomusa acidovorans (strain ATCC 49682 / DSM 3132 / Mol) TaxID=1123286 RepID=A0ABZ3J7E8_SPOA4|nr:OmpH family outer membrane protein [Sporomusa acidovorans]OZC19285.1 outer membrane protein (OmpH-like) [Sporomusa acidovorans DSM 3132]SDD81916.1 periplasmic chaperone for outer membrane proteins Skp [Sporomusa acidovorans]